MTKTKTFVVDVLEVWHSDYEVVAESYEQAKDLLNLGMGDYLGNAEYLAEYEGPMERFELAQEWDND